MSYLNEKWESLEVEGEEGPLKNDLFGRQRKEWEAALKNQDENCKSFGKKDPQDMYFTHIAFFLI